MQSMTDNPVDEQIDRKSSLNLKKYPETFTKSLGSFTHNTLYLH
jgi:hypothetical protein